MIGNPRQFFLFFFIIWHFLSCSQLVSLRVKPKWFTIIKQPEIANLIHSIQLIYNTFTTIMTHYSLFFKITRSSWVFLMNAVNEVQLRNLTFDAVSTLFHQTFRITSFCSRRLFNSFNSFPMVFCSIVCSHSLAASSSISLELTPAIE